MLFSIFLACKLTLVSSCHVNKKGKNNNNNKSDEKAAPCNETLDLSCFQKKRSKTQAEFKKEKKKEICVSTSRIVKRKTVCYDLHDEIWRWCIAQKQPTWQRGAPEHFHNQSNNTEGIKRIRCYHGFFQVHVQDLKKILLVKTRKLRLDQNTHILFLYCVHTYRPGLRVTPGQQATQSQHTYNGTLCNTC